MPTHAVKSTYDVHHEQQVFVPNSFDAIKPDRFVMAVARFGSAGRFESQATGKFDALSHTARVRTFALFASNGYQYSGLAAVFDALRLRDQAFVMVPGFYGRTPSSMTKTNGLFDVIKRSRAKTSGRFDIWFRMQATARNGWFDVLAGAMNQVPGLFDAMPDKTRSGVMNRFDAIAQTNVALPFSFQAFVRPGWSLRLKNTETGEMIDLGFIDADSPEKTIENVSIPDGDYEIMVLTSSLFWKETVDRFARTISIRSGEEPTVGLPPVLGLYSEVENGVTTVYWSTHTGADSGVSFGLWFSETSPVDTNRSPDQRIEYASGQTDYFYRFSQSLPLWLVVMPVKGDMHGQAAEIFLNWSDLKPRRPYDQTARNVYLDENLPILQQDQ